MSDTENNWLQPTATSKVDVVFGGNMRELLPPYDSIPLEFKRGRTKWNKLQSDWFYKGLPKGTEFIPKGGINSGAAVSHLAAIQGSFEPKHEHKTAAVAWLMSLWFDDVKIPQEVV